MRCLQFIHTVSKLANPASAIRNPFPVAAEFLNHSGNTAEGQLLGRIVRSMTRDEGEFREEEIPLLSQASRNLDAVLLYARLFGNFPAHEWESLATYQSGFD